MSTALGCSLLFLLIGTCSIQATQVTEQETQSNTGADGEDAGSDPRCESFGFSTARMKAMTLCKNKTKTWVYIAMTGFCHVMPICGGKSFEDKHTCEKTCYARGSVSKSVCKKGADVRDALQECFRTSGWVPHKLTHKKTTLCFRRNACHFDLNGAFDTKDKCELTCNDKNNTSEDRCKVKQYTGCKGPVLYVTYYNDTSKQCQMHTTCSKIEVDHFTSKRQCEDICMGDTKYSKEDAERMCQPSEIMSRASSCRKHKRKWYMLRNRKRCIKQMDCLIVAGHGFRSEELCKQKCMASSSQRKTLPVVFKVGQINQRCFARSMGSQCKKPKMRIKGYFYNKQRRSCQYSVQCMTPTDQQHQVFRSMSLCESTCTAYFKDKEDEKEEDNSLDKIDEVEMTNEGKHLNETEREVGEKDTEVKEVKSKVNSSIAATDAVDEAAEVDSAEAQNVTEKDARCDRLNYFIRRRHCNKEANWHYNTRTGYCYASSSCYYEKGYTSRAQCQAVCYEKTEPVAITDKSLCKSSYQNFYKLCQKKRGWYYSNILDRCMAINDCWANTTLRFPGRNQCKKACKGDQASDDKRCDAEHRSIYCRSRDYVWKFNVKTKTCYSMSYCKTNKGVISDAMKKGFPSQRQCEASCSVDVKYSETDKKAMCTPSAHTERMQNCSKKHRWIYSRWMNRCYMVNSCYYDDTVGYKSKHLCDTACTGKGKKKNSSQCNPKRVNLWKSCKHRTYGWFFNPTKSTCGRSWQCYKNRAEAKRGKTFTNQYQCDKICAPQAASNMSLALVDTASLTCSKPKVRPCTREMQWYYSDSTGYCYSLRSCFIGKGFATQAQCEHKCYDETDESSEEDKRLCELPPTKMQRHRESCRNKYGWFYRGYRDSCKRMSQCYRKTEDAFANENECKTTCKATGDRKKWRKSKNIAVVHAKCPRRPKYVHNWGSCSWQQRHYMWRFQKSSQTCVRTWGCGEESEQGGFMHRRHCETTCLADIDYTSKDMVEKCKPSGLMTYFHSCRKRRHVYSYNRNSNRCYRSSGCFSRHSIGFKSNSECKKTCQGKTKKDKSKHSNKKCVPGWRGNNILRCKNRVMGWYFNPDYMSCVNSWSCYSDAAEAAKHRPFSSQYHCQKTCRGVNVTWAELMTSQPTTPEATTRPASMANDVTPQPEVEATTRRLELEDIDTGLEQVIFLLDDQDNDEKQKKHGEKIKTQENVRENIISAEQEDKKKTKKSTKVHIRPNEMNTDIESVLFEEF